MGELVGRAAGKIERQTEEKARPVFEDLQRQASENSVIEPKVVYGYFPVQSLGDDVIVYHIEEFNDDGGSPLVGARLVSPSSAAEVERQKIWQPKSAGRGGKRRVAK